MDILDSKKLTQALQNTFKSELNFLNERNSLVEKITEKNRLLYNDIENERSEVSKVIISEWRSGNISQEEGKKRMKELKERYASEKNNLNNSKDISLFKEYEKKYKQPIEINNFENKIEFIYDDTAYVELIEYKKYYMSNSFKVKFEFSDPKSEQKVNSINLQASDSDSNNNIISITINIEENKDFNLQEIKVSTEEQRFIFTKNSLNPKGIEIFSEIKEDDLLNLDSSEKEDFLLMLHDCSINLSDVPLYKVFKEGLKDFEKEIEKALSVKKKISNKI